jgi:hypothetical protein
MRRKLKEFLNLQQGNHTIYDYCKKFNNLTQYGPHHMDMDDKMAELDRNGLNIHLHVCLILFPTPTYNALASAAID